MIDFSMAVKRPFTDLKKLVIGAILYLIPIVNFLAMGYGLKCAKAAMKKDYALPEWTEWGDLFVKGLLLVVINIVYMIPAILVSAVLVGGSFTLAEGNTALATAGGSLLISALLFLLTAYVLPSAIMSFVESDYKLESAFKIGDIVKKAFKTDYFVVWIAMVLYSIIVMTVLSMIPIIGYMVAGFMVLVTTMTAFGELYPTLKA